MRFKMDTVFTRATVQTSDKPNIEGTMQSVQSGYSSLLLRNNRIVITGSKVERIASVDKDINIVYVILHYCVLCVHTQR